MHLALPLLELKRSSALVLIESAFMHRLLLLPRASSWIALLKLALLHSKVPDGWELAFLLCLTMPMYKSSRRPSSYALRWISTSPYTFPSALRFPNILLSYRATSNSTSTLHLIIRLLTRQFTRYHDLYSCVAFSKLTLQSTKLPNFGSSPDTSLELTFNSMA